MSEAQFDREMEQNKRAFAEQRDRIRREYAGQYVGFAFGRVMAAGPNFDKVVAAMDALDPRPEASVVFRADDEPMFEPYYDTYSEFVD
jgi:hypothetical protein